MEEGVGASMEEQVKELQWKKGQGFNVKESEGSNEGGDVLGYKCEVKSHIGQK